ncbi:MAG: hypothetical protein LBI02_10735 [Opitutaceae bacterium]|jgi:hypothetical protein|nr:hypothetical protein [Opitutaceae bacterium]
MKSRHITSWLFAAPHLAAFVLIRNVLAPPFSLFRRKTADAKRVIAAILVLGLPHALPAEGGDLIVNNGDYEYHYYGGVLPLAVLHADMIAHFSHPDFMWGYSINGETFSFHLEIYELRKAPNGDWWADWVVLNGIESEFQNLGTDPFLWGLQQFYASSGATASGTWMSCYFGYPPSDYRPSSITLSANGMVTTAGIRHIYAQGGASLTFNMSASSPNNHFSGISLCGMSGQTESDWLLGSNTWQPIYSTSGTSASFSYTLDPNVCHYYFLCRSMGDVMSVPAIMHVGVTTTTGTTPNTIQGWDVSLYENQAIWPGVDYSSFAESARGVGMDNYDNIHPYQYMISDHTGWVTVSGYGDSESESWTPPHAGDYHIYYIQLGNDEWANSNMAGPYTLHVLPAGVTAQNITASVGSLTLDTFTSVASVNIAPGLSYSSHVIIQGYGKDPDLVQIPAGVYQFQIALECSDDDPYNSYCGVPTDIISPACTLTVTSPSSPPPGPVTSLSIAASTANGQISAGASGSMTVYAGETISVTSTATADGWLSEHNICGYSPDSSLFTISGGAAMLPAVATTVMSGRTVTWTSSGAGPHTIYAEAFTGTTPGGHQYGISGWPGYAGGPFGGIADMRISVNVRHNPTGSVQVLDEQGNPLQLEGLIYKLTPNAVFYLRVNGVDADGDASRYYSRVQRPDETYLSLTDDNRDSGDGYNGSRTFGPFTANPIGDWHVWGHVTDATARNWDSINPWDENGHGWYSSAHYKIRVLRNLTEIDFDTGLPYGMADSNTNGILDIIEYNLGLHPAADNDSDPRIQELKAGGTREYEYDANGQLINAPERAFTIDPEGNVLSQ